MAIILAIDDNEDNLVILKAIIKENFPGYSVYTALNGPKGIEMAVAKDPDVILLDIVMPEMNGFEVCLWLKSDERISDIPIVFITANNGDKSDRIKALEIGAEGFLSKPIDETELIAQIKAMVKIKYANRQSRYEKERLKMLIADRTDELGKSRSAILGLLEELRAENEMRKNTEEALRESENHFRSLADSGMALIWGAGVDKKCNYFNQSWLKFTGRTLEQESGYGWTEGIHPDDLQRCIEIYEQAFEERSKFSMEYRLLHFSGEYRWLQDDGTPCYSSKGDFIGYIGHCLDTTERKMAESALLKSERKYRLLFTEMLEGFALHEIICDENGAPADYKFLDMNPAFEKLTGLKRADTIGKTVLQLMPDTEKFWIERYGQVALAGEPIMIEEYSVSLNKYYQVIAFHTQLTQFAVLFTDITERKLAEEALRENDKKHTAMIANIGDVICIMDINGLLKYSSTNIEKWFGWTADDLVGADGWVTVHPDDLERVKTQFYSLLKSDNSTCKIEYRFLCKDAAYKWIELTAVNCTNNPAINGILLNYHDISERKQTEVIINNSLKEKEILLQELHHRTKNNMQVICGLLGLKRIAIKDENIIRILKDMEDRIKSMALVHQKLYQSKDYSRIDLSDYITDLAHSLISSYSLSPDKIKLNMSLERIPILIDSVLPCGLLLNELISNSLKYAFPGDMQGEICIRLKKTNENEIQLTVSDNGIGIKKEINPDEVQSLGLILIKSLAVDQLIGEVEMNTENGVSFDVKFKDNLYTARV